MENWLGYMHSWPEISKIGNVVLVQTAHMTVFRFCYCLQFDTLRECMLSNRQAFAGVLGDVESMGSSKTEVPGVAEDSATAVVPEEQPTVTEASSAPPPAESSQ